MTHGTTPPGWYDDGQGAQRWWDGNGWTEHTQPPPPPTQPPPPAQPDPHSEPTRFGGPTPGQQGQQPSTPSLDKGAGGPPPAQPPSSDVTQVAPQNPGYPAQPGYQQAGYGAPPAWQQPYTPSGSGGQGRLVALIGGGVAAVIVVIVLAVVLLGGGGGPSGTVEDFLDAAADGDCSLFEHASNASLRTDEDGRDDAVDEARQQCDDEGSGVEEGAADGCDIEATDEAVDGDTASVDYEISGCDDDSANAEGSFDLVEEDGEWRIEGLLAPSS